MFKIFKGYHLIEALHLQKAAKRFTQSHYLRMVGCSVLSLIIACLPTNIFGIEGLTVIEQRVIALFFFAASMWLTEALPAWGTSFLVIVIMCLTISDRPLSFFAVENVGGDYGHLVPYKSIMATMADPTIMLFIGGFVLAIGMTKSQFDLYMAKVMLKPFGNKSNNFTYGKKWQPGIFVGYLKNLGTSKPIVGQQYGVGLDVGQLISTNIQLSYNLPH